MHDLRPVVLSLLIAFAATASADERIAFNRDIRPILSDKCFACHGPDKNHRQAELRLDTRDGARADRDGSIAVVPGKPDESALVERITHADADLRMPPAEARKDLTPAEIDLLRRWIAAGAVYEDHWAYVPPKRPDLPAVAQRGWAANEIDLFLLEKLEAAKLAPAPEADQVTLLRRLHFDLIGLPPTPAEVDAFLADDSPEAWERVVDRLLASPHYGERMAMYWLDLVRYADTVGYHGDQEHHTTLYRDYVIQAFRENKPFDVFTLEQLAGDLLPEPTVDQRIASGYNRLLQTSHEGGVQQKEYLAKYGADRVRNFSAVWLGGTMGCAECHDHKYDPYTQADFYSLIAILADIDDFQTFKGGDTSPTKRLPEIEALSPFDRQRIADIDAEIVALGRQTGEGDAAVETRADVETQIAALRTEREQLEKRVRKQMVTAAIEPRPIRLLPRGDWLDDSGPLMTARTPEFLPGIAAEGRISRLDLARWLTSPEQPQTARVFVNRLWYLLFGKGLSRSLDDFGSQGEVPSHPELLDWLAVEFRERGWDVKHMVKRIVMSSTYRQSSIPSDDHLRLDPQNRLFGRQNRFRLQAEMIRDNALAVSGLLVDRVGGPSARPYQPAGYYAHLNFPTRSYLPDNDDSQYRRGVYVHWQRQYLHPMLRAFDAPSREECTAERIVSNTPTSALTLLNDPTFLEAARVLAVRVLEQTDRDDDGKLAWLWREVLSREATGEELAVLRRLLEANRTEYTERPETAQAFLDVGLAPRPKDYPLPEVAAWSAVCRALLNLNETISRN